MPYPLHLTFQRQYPYDRAPARAWRRVVRDLVAVQAQCGAEARRVARFLDLEAAEVNLHPPQ